MLLLLGSALHSLLLAEFAVRWFTPQALVVPWQDEIGGITAPRPGVSGRHFVPGVFDVQISYGPQRFRGGAEITPEPPEGVLRIATLGDSFTFGYGAEDIHTYPAKLEEILNEKIGELATFRRVEVINAGNGGTGTGEQALWFDRWVQQFNPQLVILGVTSNDLDDDLRRGLFTLDSDNHVAPLSDAELSRADTKVRAFRRVANALPGYEYLAQRSQLLALVRNTVSHQLATRRSAPGIGVPTVEARERLTERSFNRATAILEGEISWLNQRVKQSGARLTIFFLPSRESIYSGASNAMKTVRDRSMAIRGALDRVSAREAIPFRDLTLDLRSAASRAGPELFFSGLDTHPTPQGYAVIASSIAGELLGQN